jgi:hypothetical protein
MVSEEVYYLLHKKGIKNSAANAIIRVSPGNRIEKLAGESMLVPEKMEIYWELGYPFFQGCKQKLISKFEAKEYIKYFNKKNKK